MSDEFFEIDDELNNAHVAQMNKLREYQLKSDFEQVLSTRAGRNVIWHILEQGQLFHALPTDGEELKRQAGRHDLALAVWAQVWTASPQTFILMGNEAQEAERKFEQAALQDVQKSQAEF